MAGSADIDYEVYRLLSKRITAENRVEYLVRWKGFSPDWDTWEPADNLQDTCSLKISNFEKKITMVKNNYAKMLVNRSKQMKKDSDNTDTVKRKGRPPNKDREKDKGKVKTKEAGKLKKSGVGNVKKTKVGSKQSSVTLDDVFEAILSPKQGPKQNTSQQASLSQETVLDDLNTTPSIKRGGGRPRKHVKRAGDKKQFSFKFNNKFNQRAKFSKLGRKKKLSEVLGQTGDNECFKKVDVSVMSPSSKRKYTKRSGYWKVKGSSSSDPNVFVKDVNDNDTPDLGGVTPQAETGESGQQQDSGTPLSPGDGSSGKRKYTKRNAMFWARRNTHTPNTDGSLSHATMSPVIANSESVDHSRPADKLALKYCFKISNGKTDKSLLSLSENSKIIKRKKMFKSQNNGNKSQFKLSTLIGGNKIQGQNFKAKRSPGGKDGVKKKVLGRPRVKHLEDTGNEASDDSETLYSLAEDPSTNAAETGKERSKSETFVRKEKKSPEGGQKKGKKYRSKSDGLDVARMSNKQKMRLLDSLRATAAAGNTVSKPVRPVSPTLLYTTVKPSAATATVLPSSQLVQPLWVVQGESPTEATRDDDQASLPLSPATMSYKVLIENLPQQLHPKKNKRVLEESEEDVERRISVRATECAFKYKEILIKKYQKYTQIWLNTHTKMKNALNPLVIQEISSALSAAKYDDSTLVMLSGLGNVFCSGIDLHFLTSGDRRVAARQMGDALRDLIRKFTTFPKVIVAVVTGPAIGLGTAILPLCDIVYASDKATFYLPYGQLAQTPEGCSSYTIPQCCGTAMASELLMAGRKITAIEACQLGLVSQVYWPTSMMQEVIPRVQHMAQTSAKALETTKLLIRSHQRTKLDLTNESECNLLVERWPTVECQRAMEEFLCNEKNYTL